MLLGLDRVPHHHVLVRLRLLLHQDLGLGLGYSLGQLPRLLLVQCEESLAAAVRVLLRCCVVLLSCHGLLRCAKEEWSSVRVE